MFYEKEYNQYKKDNKKRGLRASFWFSTVNRIIDKTFGKKISHIKNKTETQIDFNRLIKELKFNNEEEEVTSEYKKDLDLDKIENDYKDELGQIFNYSFKRRGTLNSGLFGEESFLQNTSFDFED